MTRADGMHCTAFRCPYPVTHRVDYAAEGSMFGEAHSAHYCWVHTEMLLAEPEYKRANATFVQVTQ